MISEAVRWLGFFVLLGCAVVLLLGFLVLLVIACVLRGVVQGMSQPLMYAILSHEVGSHQQGASVGLRNAFVRLGSIVTPTAMGVAAEWYGIEMSFYVVGAVMMLATAGLALYGRKLSRRE